MQKDADPEKHDPGFFKPWNKCYTKKDGKKVNKKMENFEVSMNELLDSG